MKILNGFKTNIYIPNSQPDKVMQDISSNYKFLKGVYDLLNTYYPIYTDLSFISLHDISKSLLLPPCKIINNRVDIFNKNKDFIVNNFNNDYYYKFNQYIITGNDFPNIDLFFTIF